MGAGERRGELQLRERDVSLDVDGAQPEQLERG